ncbi:MAG: hypothetical protein KC613_23855, partial [Myxococcales bacterium]|nr:hypothetical protein [Myxococcales bacterium]
GAGGMGGGDCAGLRTFNLNNGPQGDGFRIQVTTGDDDVFAGTCTAGGASGAEALVTFTAPRAGDWRFATEGELDTVLYARSACLDEGSELACNDDIGGEAMLLTSAVLVPLAANETIYLVVDLYDGLEPTQVGLTAAIASGSAPVITDAECYFNPTGGDGFGAVGLRISGTDADRDLAQLGLTALDAAGAPIQGPDGPLPRAVFPPVVQSQNGDAYVVTLSLFYPEGVPAPAQCTLDLVDEAGRVSAPRTVPAAATPRNGGGACDPVGALDFCREGQACQAPAGVEDPQPGDFRCAASSPPVLETVVAHATEQALGLQVIGRDAENDVEGIALQLFDDAGNAVFEMSVLLALGQLDAQAGRFTGYFASALGEVIPLARAEVAAVDRLGNQSDVVVANFEATPTVGEGELCDGDGGWALCEAPLACLAGEGGFGECAVIGDACPAAWPVVDLNAHAANGGWTFAGDTSAEPNRGGRGSCGGGGNQQVLSFTAPAAGDYRFNIDAVGNENDDTLIFVRTRCQDGMSELVCNDDEPGGALRSQADTFVDRDQTVFVFVDGYDGNFASTYTLTVSRL